MYTLILKRHHIAEPAVIGSITFNAQNLTVGLYIIINYINKIRKSVFILIFLPHSFTEERKLFSLCHTNVKKCTKRHGSISLVFIIIFKNVAANKIDIIKTELILKNISIFNRRRINVNARNMAVWIHFCNKAGNNTAVACKINCLLTVKKLCIINN